MLTLTYLLSAALVVFVLGVIPWWVGHSDWADRLLPSSSKDWFAYWIRGALVSVLSLLGLLIVFGAGVMLHLLVLQVQAALPQVLSFLKSLFA